MVSGFYTILFKFKLLLEKIKVLSVNDRKLQHIYFIFAEILHQLEIVAVVDKVLQAIIPVNKHFKIKIGSKDAFDDILSFFKLDTQTKSKVIRILSEPEVRTINTYRVSKGNL